MITVAILKHIASKNGNYTDALEYLMFQHNEKTGKPILNENGHKMLRDEYYIDGINCEAMLFDEECEKLNAFYHKNHSFDEIKSHHYIISFDPKDREDNGLTGEKAQALGLEYAKKNFPGHQALIVTHTDGHNESGNIHVHIVINSVRKFDIPREDYMSQRSDTRAGCKHHLTNEYERSLKKDLMEMCQREHLYQVDLLSPAAKKISEKEYWAARHGQDRLDKMNEEIKEAGLSPKTTTYQTEKEKLRSAIEEAASVANSFEEFCRILKDQHQIDVIDKRGRFSYHIPDREKNISERSLGTHYGKEYLLSLFEENSRKPQQEKLPDLPVPENSHDLPPILFIKTELRLVRDLQYYIKAQYSEAYLRQVKISNLKEMAKTVAYVQENGYDTSDELNGKYDDITKQFHEARKAVRETESNLKSVNEQIHFTGQYFANKKVYAQMLQTKNKKKFRQEHASALSLYEEARKYLMELHPDGKIPSIDMLKTQKENLQIQKKAQLDTYQYFKEYQAELRTVCKNVDSILNTSIDKAANERSHSHGIS